MKLYPTECFHSEMPSSWEMPFCKLGKQTAMWLVVLVVEIELIVVEVAVVVVEAAVIVVEVVVVVVEVAVIVVEVALIVVEIALIVVEVVLTYVALFDEVPSSMVCRKLKAKIRREGANSEHDLPAVS